MEELYLIYILAVAVVAALFYCRSLSRRVRHLEGIIKRMLKE